MAESSFVRFRWAILRAFVDASASGPPPRHSQPARGHAREARAGGRLALASGASGRRFEGSSRFGERSARRRAQSCLDAAPVSTALQRSACLGA